MITTIIKEEIAISLKWDSILQETFYILNESSTIYNLKEK